MVGHSGVHHSLIHPDARTEESARSSTVDFTFSGVAESHRDHCSDSLGSHCDDTKLWTTEGIGNGTAVPNSNPRGGVPSAAMGVLPHKPSVMGPSYLSLVPGAAENYEFFRGPGGLFHAVCACQGCIPHYTVQVLPEGGAFPQPCQIHPHPVVRQADANVRRRVCATVRFMIVRRAIVLRLYLRSSTF